MVPSLGSDQDFKALASFVSPGPVSLTIISSVAHVSKAS